MYLRFLDSNVSVKLIKALLPTMLLNKLDLSYDRIYLVLRF